ncbi:two-component response regulator-like APRR9 isoform X3 [Lotus japonicus]|uniref:two-component response regulator-like APRR9 isoform X3 n=1 Tax=Lotus japonicus TaxID=34305 RepID=UPI0025907835|nr:two-component response regulator-like APRR9 isoform X3 [Lotus japonicus]
MQTPNDNGDVERILPQTALRILLVEADDSTRQIIAALLRKCSYKVVAAVRDGLKAWETLKNKAHDIDLILTEVDLPSISGFSLLTLITDHDFCKHIPVIMMSSNDSVSMVFKCMLKGAADFLIKPITKPPQKLTLAHNNKLDAAIENKPASNDSTGSVASTQKNNETSEAQSTCTSPILGAESGSMENMQDATQLKSSSNLSDIDAVKQDKSTQLEMESPKHNSEAGEKSIIFVSEAVKSNKTSTGLRLGQGYDYIETENNDEVIRTELSKGNPHISTEIRGCSDELLEPSSGAMDLIAAFGNLPKRTIGNHSFHDGSTAKFEFDTQLELSTRGDFPASEERLMLNHTNASAFSQYSSSKLFSENSPHESHELCENTNISHRYGGKNQNHNPENTNSMVIGQSGQVKTKFPNSQLGFFPATGVSFDNVSTGDGDVFPSMLYTQLTPKSVCQKESSPFPTSTSSQSNNESMKSEHHHWSDDATFTSDKCENDQSNLDCAVNDSSATRQSSSTSFYHDSANHSSSGVNGSGGSGSDGNVTSTGVDDELRGTDSHRTSQREAALTKFRLKRKDRCYDKKVRYESRKRLADKRPRVKGQFVRQVQHNEHTAVEAGGGF